jgi:hypothetical protein
MGMVSDDDLRAMTHAERSDLHRRLVAIRSDIPSLTEGARRRRLFLVVVTIAALALIPWLVVLAAELPKHYVAGHWRLAWVGFDTALMVSLALTSYLAWRRRHAVIVAAFIASSLLTCDAWFDVTTSLGPADVAVAVASALLLELPLAILLFVVGWDLLALSVRRASTTHGGAGGLAALWKRPLFDANNADASEKAKR